MKYLYIYIFYLLLIPSIAFTSVDQCTDHHTNKESTPHRDLICMSCHVAEDYSESIIEHYGVQIDKEVKNV